MNAIELKNVTKSYDGFTLENLNLNLPEGCILGLIGENGAGKTTTIELILDMIKKDSGSITVLQKDSEKEIRLLKEEIGVVLDENGLPSRLNARQIGKIMAGIYKNWDEHTYQKYLKKFDLPLKKDYKDLSRGMKMKLGIAIALSHHSRLLILDEATSGLDPVIRDEILDIFLDFTRDETHSILISSHIVSDLEKICDYIAFLHKGRLLLFEEKDMLKEKYALVQGTVEQIKELPSQIVAGMKENPYGATAMVLRDGLPTGMEAAPVDIEQLFVFMVKEQEKQ